MSHCNSAASNAPDHMDLQGPDPAEIGNLQLALLPFPALLFQEYCCLI